MVFISTNLKSGSNNSYSKRYRRYTKGRGREGREKKKREKGAVKARVYGSWIP